MTRTFAAAIFALLITAAPTRAATLVINGDFSSGFSGWTTTGLGNDLILYTPVGAGGLPGYAIGFGSTNGSDNTLTQSVPTIAGTTYDFSFTLSNSPGFGNVNDFTASLNGSPVYSVVNVDPFSPTVISDIFTATGTTTIKFAGASPAPSLYLQDVSVADVSAVPLPAAFPLFASALAGLGGFGWLKRRGKVSAGRT